MRFKPDCLNDCLQVYWTKEVGEAITKEGHKGLSKYGEKCTAELNKIVSLVRGQLTSLERATCGALVVIDVHARDVTLQVGFSCPTKHTCRAVMAPYIRLHMFSHVCHPSSRPV